MKNLLLSFILSLSLVGCVVYRVAPKDDSALKKANITSDSKVAITKVNEFPEGFQCFEPMLYILTLGVVPAHCVNTYTATVTVDTVSEPFSATYTVTMMQGWFPLLLLPLPDWHYGYGIKPEPKIENLVRSTKE